MGFLHDTRGIDVAALRRYRFGQVQKELQRRDVAAVVLFDPVNIRYATDVTNMQVWVMHNRSRCAFVPAEGKAVIFEFHNCAHLSDGVEQVGELRPAISWYYFGAGPRSPEKAREWAAAIADLARQFGGGNRRVAFDHVDPLGAAELQSLGIEIHNGQEVMEMARIRKGAEEMKAMRAAIATCERALAEMEQALRPGITENELWSILHQVNIREGGEWIETRLLSSGPRTNPWFQECSDRVINDGDLVALDTDLIGPFGYCADISRTWHCGDKKPTAEQRRLFAIALEQIEYNTGLLRAGMTFREFAESGYELPDNCKPNRYSVVAHGVGLCDEYPHIVYPQDMKNSGYDGVIHDGMVLCVESYVGVHGGGEGVKLEQQVVVGERGAEVLSRYPWCGKLRG